MKKITIFLLCLAFYCLSTGSVKAQTEFITTWLTTVANDDITIPTIGSGYNYNVDWGDGATSSNVIGTTTHVYANAGLHVVMITGDFPRIIMQAGSVANKNKLLSINQWGTIAWTSFDFAFSGCFNLTMDATDVPDLSGVSSIVEMFFSNLNLDISTGNWNWNVSNVTNMSGMFENSYFNFNIDNWDVSNVTNMSGMFKTNYSFNQPLENWNVSSVTTMEEMFYRNRFNQPIGNWDVSNVTNMGSMFEDAGFNQPIDNWDVSSVTNMSHLFDNTTSFNQDIGNWNVSNVTDMSSMFYQANKFNQDINNWNVSNVINMSYMFNSIRDMYAQVLNNWDVSKVTNMSSMFSNSSLNAPNIENWDVSSVTNMGDMLSAVGFNEDIGNWDVSNVTNMLGMFNYNYSFNQDLSSWDVGNVTNMAFMFQDATVYNQDLGNWNVSNVTNMTSILEGTALSTANYDSLLIGWNSLPSLQVGVRMDVTNSQYCDGATARQDMIDNYSWQIYDAGPVNSSCGDTGGPTYPPNAFVTTWLTTVANGDIIIPTTGSGYNYNVDWGDGATSSNVIGTTTHVYANAGLHVVMITGDFPRIIMQAGSVANKNKLLSINQWGTIAWTSFDFAFSGCHNLTMDATDVPDLSGVSSMEEMFFSNLNIEISTGNWNWDVSNVTNMSGMFENNYFNFNIDNWDVSNVTNMSGMFRSNYSFNQPLGNWDVSSVTDMEQMFYRNNFNQPIGNWDVSNVTNMGSMFEDAGFNQPIDNWNVGSVTNMSHLFDNTTSFNQDIGNWDVSSVTNMSGMFYEANKFNQDINNWNVSNVINMSYMFNSTREMYTQVLNNWDVSKVTNMSSMFSNSSLNAPNIENWDVSSVTDMADMLSAVGFNEDIGNWNVSNVTNMLGMFNFNYFFNQDLSSWDVSNVTNMGFMLQDATAYNQDLGNWNVSNVTNMTSMLEGTALSIENYDSLLMGWNSLPSLQIGVRLDVTNTSYCDGETARQDMIDNYGWQIYDSGLDCTTLNVLDFNTTRFLIYPNPLSNSLSIRGLNNNNNQLQIINIQGQSLLEINNYNGATIPVNTLVGGVYFVKVQSGDHSKVIKIIKTD